MSTGPMNADRFNTDPAAEVFIQLQTVRRQIADASRAYLTGQGSRLELVALLNEEVRLSDEFHKRAEPVLLVDRVAE